MKPYEVQFEKCKNGHFKTEATNYIHPKTGVVSCRLCRQVGKKRERLSERERDRRILERLKDVPT